MKVKKLSVYIFSQVERIASQSVIAAKADTNIGEGKQQNMLLVGWTLNFLNTNENLRVSVPSLWRFWRFLLDDFFMSGLLLTLIKEEQLFSTCILKLMMEINSSR